ncbi:hypothetical protein C0993_003588 [Termitomyces sp. T159_Od127]|nr:hypothetical protein C0993_003588 [Termitomyces sp. T159_Od127]
MENSNATTEPKSPRSYAAVLTDTPPCMRSPVAFKTPEITPPNSPKAPEQQQLVNFIEASPLNPPAPSPPEILTPEQRKIGQTQTETEDGTKSELDNPNRDEEPSGGRSERLQAKPDEQQGWQVVTPRKARRKERRAARVKEQNKGPYAEPSPKEKGNQRHAKRLGNGDRNTSCPSPVLSLSAFDYTDEENTPMEVDTDPFNESTPRAGQNTDIEPSQDNQPQNRPLHKPTLVQNTTPGGRESTPIQVQKAKGQHDTPPHTNGGQTPRLHPDPQERQNEEQEYWEQEDDSPMRENSPTLQSEHNEEQQLRDDNAPELWTETTYENVTTNGKGLRRTATSNGGWPQIHLAASPTFNIAPNTLREWENLTGPTL